MVIYQTIIDIIEKQFLGTFKKNLGLVYLFFYTFLSVTLDRFADRVGVRPRKQK